MNRRDATTLRVFRVALAGLLLGLGLGIWTNVSGVVLAFYIAAGAVVLALLLRS